METEPLVRLRGITKRFGRVTVLEGVDFELRAGETHILAGENGAGKSTLIKILAGIHTDFEGTIEISGRPTRLHSPQAASAAGIAVIHQELSLIGAMSVADNIFLGRAPTRGGFVQEEKQAAEAAHWVRQLGLEINVRRPVEEFALGIQQLIEIAKVLSQNARVLVMDEPTSALTAPEVKRLFDLIQTLKGRGCGIVYISHKMEEIERIADRITVLRDGRLVGSAPARELPAPKLIAWMVGRELTEQFPRRSAAPGKERLRLEKFSVHPQGLAQRAAAQDIDLTVRAGEIVGLAGLQGAGSSELFLGLFGAYGDATRGRAALDGEPIHFTAPRSAIASGLALLTNDRKATGLVLSLSIIANATLAGLRELSPHGWRAPEAERAAAEKSTAPLHLRAASLELEVGALSGGNQQKVALAKWLQTGPKVLLLDEPTRGIDIAAKREIYQLIDDLTARGIAILLITSEMPELLTLSDRIVVLHRGEITAEFGRAEASPEKILAAAMGAAA
ncbi:MAG TPA: sugar ABC transporter ATP-binding protein [Verrucomicrobiae bacterium]|jgi:ABC-type sugar transport system ATPase subunit|nr:sugar ABC transporter ATP-binding protein [Verrucomicrobiae bacterium]